MYWCPNDDFTCPYNNEGKCSLENAPNECDDFYGLEDEDFEVEED